ncbi:Uncharacterized protein Adt_21966 [Abeliophyllum distichum]|uniref:Ty3-gypsy retrotransposon protein n=1 Tax=Abeliophyllum distichum TaxID=126358 RepID=A0ABD1T130_9LAMI
MKKDDGIPITAIGDWRCLFSMEWTPNGWICRAERYFAVNQMVEVERLEATMKYTIDHRCKNKELQVLLIQDGDEWKLEEVVEGEATEDEGKEVGEVVELSLNSVVGLTPPQTMKVKGKIAGREVVILIDCGASHNFISTELVQKLGIPRTATIGYGVIMGTGLAIQGAGVCKGVMLETQHVKIKDDFLPLELGSSDVIQGMKWLATLGCTQINWRDLTMKFQAFKEHGEGVLLELGNITSDFNDDQLEIPETLLEGVFVEPRGLPPRQE